MAKRESLRAYQDMILEKMQAARLSEAGQLQLLFGFRAADKNFLIDGKHIMEMASPTKLEPIPVSKPWAVGVANIKGSVYSVTDFSILMGHEPIKNGKFLLLDQAVMAGSAIRIEALTGLYDFKIVGAALQNDFMNGMPTFIESCHIIAGQQHFLINAASLAEDTKFSKLQNGESK